MMHTKNCKTVHEYLNKDLFDHEDLYLKLQEYYADIFVELKDYLETYFRKPIENLRNFFTLADGMVAELYQEGKTKPEPWGPGKYPINLFQSVECFILSQNFHGPNTGPLMTYLARNLSPLVEVMNNARIDHSKGEAGKLKYIV